MTHGQYPNITPDEEAKIRRDASYSGLRDEGEAVLRQMQREREQGGTDAQILACAMRQNPAAVQDAIARDRRALQMGGLANADSLTIQNVVDRLVGRR